MILGTSSPDAQAVAEPSFDVAHKMQRAALDLAWRCYGADDEHRVRFVEWLREYGQVVWQIAVAAQAAEIARLTAALQDAVDAIRLWHGMGLSVERETELWTLYQESPEMGRINAALHVHPAAKEQP